MKRFVLKPLLLLCCLFAVHSQLFAQAAITLGPDIALPCDSACVTLTATVTGVTGSTSSYTIDSIGITYPSPYPYVIAGSTALPNDDDTYSSTITLPFTFCFYGISYTQFYMGTNADIVFNMTGTGPGAGGFDPWNQENAAMTATVQIPNANYPTKNYYAPAIMGMYGDWETSAAYPIKYIVQGVAPNRVFIENITTYEYSCTGKHVTAQVVLHETSNIIDVYIENREVCTSWNLGSAITGIQKSNTVGIAVPGHNATNWGGDGLNKAYRFIPSGSPTVNLLSSTGAILQTITNPDSVGVGIYTVTFAPVCPATSPTSYIAQVEACSSTLLEDTINVTSGSAVTPAAGSNSPVCAGGTLSLTATGEPATVVVSYNWAGPDGFTSTLQNPTIPGATAVNAGVYSVTASYGGCSSLVGTITVVVTATPTITATFSDPTGCSTSDGTITLSGATPGTSYTVTYNAGTTPVTTTIAANGSGQVIISGLPAGTYTNISITAGCPSNTIASIVLTGLTSPAIPVATVVSPICEGQTLTFTGTDATAGVTWSWSGPGFAAPDTAQNPTIAFAAPGATGIYTLTVTNAGCSSSTTIGALVNPMPSIPVTGSNSPVCSGNELDLTAASSPGVVYSWTGPASYAATTTAGMEAITGATPANSGIYTVTATLNGCTAAPATVTVIVNLTPAAPVTADVSYCQYAYATPLTAVGTNLLWYTAAAGGTGSAAAPVPPTATVGSTTWYVSQTSYQGCEGPRAPITVTIVTKPAAPAVTATYTYCQLDVPVVLSATGSALEWYGPGNTAAYTVTPLPSTDSPGIVAYYVTQTIAGCTSDSATITVTVLSKPAPPVTDSLAYCQGASAPALTAQGTNLLWYTTATGGVGSASAPVPGTSLTGVTTLYVTQTGSDGCESFRTPLQVTIHWLPVFTIGAGKPYDCQYDTLSLFYSGLTAPGAMYSWTVPSYASINDSTAASVITTFDTSFNVNQVSLTVGDGYTPCNVTETYSVTVYNTPIVAFYVKPDVCLGDTVTVALSYTNGQRITNYLWNFSGATILFAAADSAGPYEITWPDPGVHNVTLTAVSGESCPSKPAGDTVNVHAYPDAEIGPLVLLNKKTSICMGDSVQFTPLNYQLGNYYGWSPANYFYENDGANAYGIIYQPGFVDLKVTNAYGCSSSDSVLVNAQSCCGVVFPDAFTPNGDGLNDVFRPITVSNNKVHDFRIVNRWGQTVFESAEINGAWDGKLNGVPQDMDVYFYYFSYDCEGKKMDMKGEVNLVR